MYIGRTPEVGNYRKADSISVVNGQATYNLTVNSEAVNPNANQVICSLNGVIQSSNDSFSIANNQITFASNLQTGDVIDFILILGDTLDVGTPSDNTVSTDKLVNSSVTLAKLSATGTKDATTFLRGDNTFATVTSTTINNNADNRVITGSGTANTLEGEANLTFDGTTLGLTNTSDGFKTIDLDANRGSAGDFLGDITGKWNGTDVARISFRAGSDTSNKDDGTIHFETSSAGGSLGESFKILANKKIQFGGNTDLGINVTPGDAKLHISEALANITGMISNDGSSGGTGHTHIAFKRQNSTVGSISATNSSTSFNTSSDYRLKENVTYDWDATTRLKQLKPARFNWIDDDTNTLIDGFIAHEVTAVPEAISGTKDATETKNNVVLNSDGKMLDHSITEAEWTAGKEQTPPKYPTDSTWHASREFIIPQGIDQAKLVPLLTKALQEAITKIETLEAKVEALENA